MSTLDRYLLVTVIAGAAIVLSVLLALTGFINFIYQLDDVGTGSYTISGAAVYTLMTLPLAAYDMLPIAALLGGLLGLGALASHSELVVMRAAGISPWRLARGVAVAGLVITLLNAALGEFIAPPMERYAKSMRALSLHKQLSVAEGQGGWVRDGNVIVNIDRLIGDGRTGDISIFTVDGARLKRMGVARGARFDDNQRWNLEDYRETRFEEDGTRAETARRHVEPTRLNADILGLSVVDPDTLQSASLWEYVSYLRSNGLSSERYELAFWSRIANIASALVMTLLSLPFVFGSLRSAGAGQRILVGVLLGVGWFVGNNALSNSGTLYGFNPFVTAWLPVTVLLLVTVVALYRVR